MKTTEQIKLFLKRFVKHAASLAARMQLAMPDISDIYTEQA